MKYKLLKSSKMNAIALVIFAILTFFMVYLPVSIDISKTYIGYGEVVFWSNFFWWFEYSISNILNPLVHTYIFHPMGLRMLDGIFPMLLFVPITKLFGSVVSYNLYVLTSFAVAGYGMFLLARHITNNVYAGFIAGIIFAFFPFHFGSALGHLHTLSIQWAPFFFLYLLKMSENPTSKNIFLTSLFFAINAHTSWTITIMIAIFIGIFILFYWRCLFSKEYYLKTISFFVLCLVLSSPALYVMLSEIITNKHMAKSAGDFIYYSSDLLGFVTPSPLHSIFGNNTAEIYKSFSGNISENITFIGYTVLFLSVVGAFFSWSSKYGKFFTTSVIVFFILSLGPVLHINGVYSFTRQNIEIILPGFLSPYIPVLDMIRVPSRYFIMAMLGLSILSAYGICMISKWISESKLTSLARILLLIIIPLGILFEYMTKISTQNVVKVPEFYHSLGDVDLRKPILEVPVNLIGARSHVGASDGKLMIHYYEYQKIHKKPIIGGYWSRVTPQYEAYLHSDPVLSYLATAKYDIIDIELDPLQHLKTVFDFSHVVVHKAFLSEGELESFSIFLGDKFTGDYSVKDDPLMIYSLENITKNPDNEEISIKLGDGWHEIDYWGDSHDMPVRWMSSSAELIIDSQAVRTIQLSFNAYSYKKQRTIEVQSNDNYNPAYLVKKVIPSSLSPVTMSINLHKGKNVILLHSLDGTDRPCDGIDIKTNDCRNLSFAIQNVKITEYDGLTKNDKSPEVR